MSTGAGFPKDGLCFLTAMTPWALEALVEQIESGVSFLWPSHFLVPSSLENETTLSKCGSAHQVVSSSASTSALRICFAIVPGSEPAKGRGEGRRLRL